VLEAVIGIVPPLLYVAAEGLVAGELTVIVSGSSVTVTPTVGAVAGAA
jgi:hypothetical protein